MGYNIAIFVAGNSDSRGSVMAKLIQSVIPTARCVTLNARTHFPKFWQTKKNTKATYVRSESDVPAVKRYMQDLANSGRYDAFVCIDIGLAHYLIEEPLALQVIDKLGGQLMQIGDKPMLMHFDPLHTYGRQHDPEHHAAYALMSSFMVKKLFNPMSGIPSAEKPVRFSLPTSEAELLACKELAAKSKLIAFDIETSGGFISCIGFACETSLPYVPVFVLPLYVNIDDSHGSYWASQSLAMTAFTIAEQILANDVPKVAHNGSYDLSYIFRYGWYVNNYVFDTMLMMHATWPTVPRSLYVGASMFLDNYRFWKDDAKEVDEDGKTKWVTPREADKTFAYWLYNGLDCANTLELCLAILRFWTGETENRYPENRAGNYFWRTYVRKFAIEFGPVAYMSMTGIRADANRQAALSMQLKQQAAKARSDLSVLLGDPDFNPNSPPQTAFVIYDLLGIKPLTRKGRVTDKRILQKFADLHPVYNDVITSIWAVKEPLNNASKYGEMPLLAGTHFAYQLKASATTTARLASSKHNLGYGTNVQNLPKPMRVMFTAEPGEVLVSADYSQSDSYFVAFESGDEAMMKAVTDDRDTHSVHVEFFFGHKYEDVVAGDKAKASWVVHPVTGVRQIIKKVSHGTNYDMGGDTMLLNIRREAAITMVNALLSSVNAKTFMKYMGLDASKGAGFYEGQGALWSDPQLAKACDFAQRLYYARYPELKRWKVDAVADAHMTFGVIEMFGGSCTRMLCAPSKNPRFVPAAKGQGGTAGNINNAMLRLYYLADDMWQDGFRMTIQVHDELVSSIPEGKWYLAERKVAIMETPCEIKGRKFTIPVEADLAYSWDPKNTVAWQGGDADYSKLLREAENKTRAKLGVTLLED